MHMTPLILFQFVHQVFKQTPPPRTEPTPKTRTVVLVFWVRVRVGLNGGCLRRGGGSCSVVLSVIPFTNSETR